MVFFTASSLAKQGKKEKVEPERPSEKEPDLRLADEVIKQSLESFSIQIDSHPNIGIDESGVEPYKFKWYHLFLPIYCFVRLHFESTVFHVFPLSIHIFWHVFYIRTYSTMYFLFYAQAQNQLSFCWILIVVAIGLVMRSDEIEVQSLSDMKKGMGMMVAGVWGIVLSTIAFSVTVDPNTLCGEVFIFLELFSALIMIRGYFLSNNFYTESYIDIIPSTKCHKYIALTLGLHFAFMAFMIGFSFAKEIPWFYSLLLIIAAYMISLEWAHLLAADYYILRNHENGGKVSNPTIYLTRPTEFRKSYPDVFLNDFERRMFLVQMMTVNCIGTFGLFLLNVLEYFQLITMRKSQFNLYVLAMYLGTFN